MKTKIALFAAVFLFLGTFAYAAEFLNPTGDKNPNISTTQAESHKNLYAAGATVNINGPTNGDLVAAGAVVTVNGNVEDDLIVAGGNLNLNGAVGGNLRAGGGNVSVNSAVGSDLLIAGGNVSITEKAGVAGDLIAGAGNLVVDSEIKGNARLAGGNININGKINGNLQVMANEQLIFGPNSEVVGKITYKGVKPAIVKTGAKVGTIQFTKLETRAAKGVKGLFTVGLLIKSLAVLLAGFVLHYFFRGRIYAVVDRAKENPLHSLGMGFVTLVVSPILAILLCVTVIGFYLGLLLFLMYALLLVLTAVLATFYIGNLVYGWYKKDARSSYRRDLILGVVISFVLMFIPFIGPLMVFIAYLITLGSLVQHYREKAKQEQMLA